MTVLIGLVIVVLIVGGAVLWLRRSRQTSGSATAGSSQSPAGPVRVDLEALRAIPSLAGAVSAVRWPELQTRPGGPAMVGGVADYGPNQLTWTPDDRARADGAAPWRVAWSDVASGSVRTATTDSPAALQLTLTSGGHLTLEGIDEQAALTALRRRSPD